MSRCARCCANSSSAQRMPLANEFTPAARQPHRHAAVAPLCTDERWDRHQPISADPKGFRHDYPKPGASEDRSAARTGASGRRGMTTEQQIVDVGRGIELCYEQIGDPNDTPIV